VGKKLAEGKVELLNRLTGVTDDISVVEVVEQFRAGILGQSPRVEARTL
jgi:hypothetical protein